MWHRNVKGSTERLSTVRSCRLPDWSSLDSQNAWLNTLEDMDFQID